MTGTMTLKNPPPYPRLGELYRALAGALDTKVRAEDCNVDRLAREGEYDWSLLPTLQQTLITKPLKAATDIEFAELVGQFAGHLHSDYLRVVAHIALDSLNRAEALPLLVEHYFAPQGINLLCSMKRVFDGPDLVALLDPAKQPIAVVLDWFDQSNGLDFVRTTYPASTDTDRLNRELITRWATGTQIPDSTTIKRIAEDVSKRVGSIEQEWVRNLRRWMVAARALSWLENKSPVPFRGFMLRHLLLGLPEIDIGRILSLAIIEAGERFSALTMPALMLYEDLKRTTPKAPGDQARTQENLTAFRRLCEDHDPEGRTRFHLDWLLGRWNVLSGRYRDALHHYQQAAKLANYRAGGQQKQIVEETLVLAAFIGGNKPLLKRLKHRAIVLGLFTDPRSAEVIEDWEIEHLRQQFHRTFPRQGRFREAADPEGDQEQLPFLILNKEQLAALEPDLRNPNRVRTVRAPDGQTRRWPQLGFFASVGRIDAVEALLEHGASVDQLDEAGGSALLNALQRAEDTGDRRALDLLLEHRHSKDSLDSATTRKRHTPLICAVRYGEPDVVGRLLAMGATPDRRGQVDDLTPLYRCLSSIGAIRKPAGVVQSLRDSLLADPDHMQREVHRRYNINLGGVFGDERTLRDSLAHPRHQAIFEGLVAAMVKEEADRLSEPKLLHIVELLLKAGANPNAAHQYPARGRTPLMLAAENDSAEAFDLMMHHGGDPYRQDAEGQDCTRTAVGFGSRRVVERLRRHGIM